MPYRTEDGLFEIGLASEEAHNHVFKVLCLKCGIRLINNSEGMLIHQKYHEEIDELIDWARSVSELFKRPESPASADEREIPSGNAGQHEASIKDAFQTGSSEEGLQKGSE